MAAESHSRGLGGREGHLPWGHWPDEWLRPLLTLPEHKS